MARSRRFYSSSGTINRVRTASHPAGSNTGYTGPLLVQMQCGCQKKASLTISTDRIITIYMAGIYKLQTPVSDVGARGLRTDFCCQICLERPIDCQFGSIWPERTRPHTIAIVGR